MKVGLIIPVIRCDMCTMRTCVFTCGNGGSWAAVCFFFFFFCFVTLAWFESRRNAGSGETKINSFCKLCFTSQGCIHQEEAESVFILLLWAVMLEGEENSFCSVHFQRETQFCLQMQFNEFWMLLGDWAAVNVGAVHSLDAGLSMFGRNVTVLIQRFWHKLIPLSAARADSEFLHQGAESFYLSSAHSWDSFLF